VLNGVVLKPTHPLIEKLADWVGTAGVSTACTQWTLHVKMDDVVSVLVHENFVSDERPLPELPQMTLIEEAHE
jgi:hypothetical protein